MTLGKIECNYYNGQTLIVVSLTLADEGLVLGTTDGPDEGLVLGTTDGVADILGTMEGCSRQSRGEWRR